MSYDSVMRLSNPLKIAVLVFGLLLGMSLLMVTIPKNTAQETVEISVMTFNIENGGTQVNFNKVVEAIQKAKADVVGIQEAWGNTAALAHALGWEYYDQRQHIISRYPLLKPASVKDLYTFVEVRPGKMVAIGNMHLPDEPYGPELIRHGATKAEVIANENKVRLPTALPFIEKLESLAHRGIPVFLTGDFNSPSHLDGKAAYGVEWPVTKILSDKGFSDAYRESYPDEKAYGGITWPAARPKIDASVDHFNPSGDDIPNRVDFIFTAGPSQVTSSQLVCEDSDKACDVTVSPWPSDHRSVVARFSVQPAPLPSKGLIRIPSRIPVAVAPSINVTPPTVSPGHTFTITWKNAPGNRYDYILITPTGADHRTFADAVRLYTFGEENGSIKFDEQTAKGNWPAWYSSPDAHWPLAPNTYDVKLMLDDSDKVLAVAEIVIK
jgi:endonuclease/exonuclease/phosphatase family metal-dependent hydrolase